MALEFQQAPQRFAHWTDPRRALPEAFGSWLTEAGAALAPARLAPIARELAASPEQVRAALRSLMRHSLLMPGADCYRVLGLSRPCPAAAIKRHHGILIRLFHPDRTSPEEAAEAARINTAYRRLRDPAARRRYDQTLTALQAQAPESPPPPGKRPPAARPLLPMVLARWGLVAGAILLGLILVTARPPEPPALRVDPERAAARSPEPAFLHAGSPPRATEDPAIVLGDHGLDEETTARKPAREPLSAPPNGTLIEAAQRKDPGSPQAMPVLVPFRFPPGAGESPP